MREQRNAKVVDAVGQGPSGSRRHKKSSRAADQAVENSTTTCIGVVKGEETNQKKKNKERGEKPAVSLSSRARIYIIPRYVIRCMDNKPKQEGIYTSSSPALCEQGRYRRSNEQASERAPLSISIACLLVYALLYRSSSRSTTTLAL